MSKSDQQLIADYLDGEEKALEELVNRYLKSIYNFIYRITNSLEEAEDITQETFLKLWKNLEKYNQEENFKAWLFAIARNTTIDWLRKKKNIKFSDFESEEDENKFENSLVDKTPLPNELAVKSEQKQKLDRVLNKLPIIYREVLLLHYYEDLTFDEIGKVLNKPLNTVKSQHRRALVAIKKLF
jgi:RNA polymerase sigma-70 factor (ECF subfamily)